MSFIIDVTTLNEMIGYLLFNGKVTLGALLFELIYFLRMFSANTKMQGQVLIYFTCFDGRAKNIMDRNRGDG